MKRIGEVGGIQIWVRWENNHQVIVVGWRKGTMGGWGLVNALAGDALCKLVDVGPGWMQAEIVHDNEVDRRIIELVDALIDVRYAHPSMVQLPLALSSEDAKKLTKVLDG